MQILSLYYYYYFLQEHVHCVGHFQINIFYKHVFQVLPSYVESYIFTYHVVYNEIFRVPKLFLRGRHSGKEPFFSCAWMDVCMYVYIIYVCMHACMYVCMYIYVYSICMYIHICVHMYINVCIDVSTLHIYTLL